jgi:hypothetical protein
MIHGLDLTRLVLTCLSVVRLLSLHHHHPPFFLSFFLSSFLPPPLISVLYYILRPFFMLHYIPLLFLSIFSPLARAIFSPEPSLPVQASPVPASPFASLAFPQLPSRLPTAAVIFRRRIRLPSVILRRRPSAAVAASRPSPVLVLPFSSRRLRVSPVRVAPPLVQYWSFCAPFGPSLVPGLPGSLAFLPC